MMNEKVIVELKNVSKSLKGKKILDNITVKFEVGKIYGIVGANASGKSMLFRAIAGLLYISDGKIDYSKHPISIGAIIENPGFLLSYTGYENLLILSHIRNVIEKEQIENVMKKVGLEPKDKRKVKEYSLGMKQKLAIAQAVMESPELLILDEPTRGLDKDSVESIRTLLLKEKERGATILISSHNPDDINILSDEIYLIEDGKLAVGVQTEKLTNTTLSS